MPRRAILAALCRRSMPLALSLSAAIGAWICAGPQARARPFPANQDRLAIPQAAGEKLRISIVQRLDGPPGRLLVLPRGTEAVTVESARMGGEDLQPERVHVGRIMSLRGTRVASVYVDCPSATVADFDLTLTARDAHGRTLSGNSGDPRGSGLAQMQSGAGGFGANRGGYLVIAHDDFAAAIQPLIDWKTACGYEVSLHRVSETGGTLNAIKSFIQNAYDTWPNPPLYVLLVGDVEFVPCGDFLGNVSDHVYACLDGDDFLADLFVGRICAKTAAEVQVQVAKIVGFESRPEMTGIDPGDTDGWFVRALMVAANHGSSTPIPTCDWVAEELDSGGFVQVDNVYYPPVSDGCSQTYGCPINDIINNGVSIVNYRGWARENPPGWDAPDYTTEDIVRLQNGWRLPFVFSIVCNTGDFGRPEQDCFGEVWVKSGTVENPFGAVGFIGTGEHWSITRWNDRIDIGIFESIVEDGVTQVGPVLASSKANLIAYFPTEVCLEDVTGEEAVEFYNYIYNILGDPSLSLWTEIPMAVSVPNLPRSIGQGVNHLELQVVTGGEATPVAGAHVTATQNGARIGYGVTDDQGRVALALALASRDSITCTVTGKNLLPLQSVIDVNEDARSLTCAGAEVSAGGLLVAGVTSDIFITLTNTGTENLTSATATLESSDGFEIAVGSTAFGPLPVGAETVSETPLRIRVDSEVENGTLLRFLLTPNVNGEELRPTEFALAVSGPEFICQSATDLDDAVFSPGETCNLALRLKNEGAIAGGAVSAELSMRAPGVTLLDSTATFEEIAPGASGENSSDPFRISIDPHLANGAVVPFVVAAHSSAGPVGRFSGNLIIGSVDIGAPLGPDAGGYYCYDSADIDYPGQVPAYRWVEVSQLYGGPGTRLAINVNDRVPQAIALPFPFVYYGASYDSMLVSDNGWASFETTYYYDERNWAMPDRWGNGCQLAPFWDNLNPQFAGTDGIYTWFDTPNHRFIIEWNRLRHISDTSNHWQAFEIVLYDPAYHPTASGDGEVVFQYKRVYNEDRAFMYATVGIEDKTEEIGIQYSYANEYPAGAAPLSAGLAVKFTTEEPVYEPLTAKYFAAELSGNSGGVHLRWELSRDWPLSGFELWRVAGDREAAKTPGERVEAGLIPASTRSYTDRTVNPSQACRYELRAIGPFGLIRTLGETTFNPFATAETTLRLAGQSPSNGATWVFYQGREGHAVDLAVYDASGRRVRALIASERTDSSRGQTVWDGCDEHGQRVASGLYWVRLSSGADQRTARLMILR